MIYEFPLTEGVRRFLRIEMLFQQAEEHMTQDSAYSTLSAIRALLDVVTLVSKNDLKIEIIKQLDHLAVHPRVAVEDKVRIRAIKDTLSRQSIRAYDEIKENMFLNILRQRLNIVGGVCAFDLPILHHWLRQPYEVRREHFYRWFAVLNTIKGAVDFTLEKTRALTITESCEFEQGFYYRSVKWKAALMRLDVGDHDFFPEFSGNRHQLSIRLVHQENPWSKPVQVKEDIALEVEICGN